MPESETSTTLRAQRAKALAARDAIKKKGSAEYTFTKEESNKIALYNRIIQRTDKILGKVKTPEKKPVPQKKPETRDEAAARRRKPVEKATGTKRYKDILTGIATQAKKRNDK